MVSNNNSDEPLVVSPRRASQLAGLGITSLYKAINDGRLQSTVVHGRRLITLKSLKKLVGVDE
jgi:hypothetical protein